MNSAMTAMTALALCVTAPGAAAIAAPEASPSSVPTAAGPARVVMPLANGWRFKLDDTLQGAQAPEFSDAAWEQVSVPHSWTRAGYYLDSRSPHVNRPDSLNLRQGIGWYRLSFTPPAAIDGKVVWLQFDAVSRVASVWLNGVFLGEHKGGFSRFRLDASKALKPGGANVLVVRADNTNPAPGVSTADVLPLAGDFVVHGGLYRPVNLIATNPIHIDMMDMGGPGVYATTISIVGATAQIAVRSKLRNGSDKRVRLTVVNRLVDAEGQVAAQAVAAASLGPGGAGETAQSLTLAQAKLWNGVKSPYLYRLVTEVRDTRGRLLDSLEQAFGVRQFHIDPDKGFFLNGAPLRLHGVGLHQDAEGKGWALSAEDIAADEALIRDMGANTIRLAHYQHGQPIHELADKSGLLLWDEIPWVSVWTLSSDQIDASPGLVANARQQLQEMIRQNYNHPSVITWGLANEIDLRGPRPAFIGGGDTAPRDRDPLPLLTELNSLAKAEDPSRPTTLATCCEGLVPDVPEIAKVTDVGGANRYYGWYYAQPDAVGPALDALRRKRPGNPLSVTEYGAGGAASQHTDDPLGGPIDAMGVTQPEEYQSLVHEQTWAALAARPYLWATWLWNSFDFATSARREGDAQDINTKGLITYDRQIKKDAFYFYRANWNPAPTVHINGRRYVDRAYPVTDVRVYSNAPSTELLINGVSKGVLQDCPQKICIWRAVRLEAGENRVSARGAFPQGVTEDHLTWRLAPAQARGFAIDSGAVLAATDGARLGSDAFFVGGVAKTTGSKPVHPEGSDGWNAKRTYREGDFAYRIPTGNGRYRVTLTFMEPAQALGARRFDVLADGKPLLSDFDIAAAAGGLLTPVSRVFSVDVANGVLELSFKPRAGKALVSTIEVTAP